MKNSSLENILESCKTMSFEEVAQELLWCIAKELNASQGAIFKSITKNNEHFLQLIAGYAYHLPDDEIIEFEYGEGLAGQVALEGKPMTFHNVPEGYIEIVSGLGSATPTSMIIYPICKHNEVIAVIELASFTVFTKKEEEYLQQISTHLEEILP